MSGMNWLSLLPTFLFISILFTSTFAYLSSPDRSKPKGHEAPPRYLAKFRVTRALREKRSEKGKTGPIPFLTLPDEIQVKILSYASEPDGIETFRALLQVTKNIRHMTLQSCLPLLSIVLNSRKRIQSFYLFYLGNPELMQCLHRIWVSPPSEEDRFPACAILKACTNTRTLACTASVLGAAICSEAMLKHENCQKLTLLDICDADWENTLPTSVASAFFRRLTHLRVVGKAIPRTLRCKNLTHLSFVCALEERDENLRGVLEDVKLFPRLKKLLLSQGMHWTAVDVVGGRCHYVINVIACRGGRGRRAHGTI